MRHIFEQLSLRDDERTQARNHAIELDAEILQFVIPRSHPVGNANVEIPVGGVRDRRMQAADRFGEQPREQRRATEAGQYVVP